MWRALASYPDDRVALECCRALELWALFRPHDASLAGADMIGACVCVCVRAWVVLNHPSLPLRNKNNPPSLFPSNEQTDFLRCPLQGGHDHRRLALALDPFLASCHSLASLSSSPPAHTLHPPACAAALACIRALAKRHAPALRAQRIEIALLALYDSAATAIITTTPNPWRAIGGLPRFNDDSSFSSSSSLETDVQATLDVVMGGDGKGRPLHYLLWARAVVLGLGSGGEGEEEEGAAGLVALVAAAGGGGIMAMEAAVAERLRARAARAAASGLPAPPRWQVKALALDVALQSLQTLERELRPHGDEVYVEARRLILRFFQQGQGVEGESSAAGLATLEGSPLLLAPLLPDILALGCHAASDGGSGGPQMPQQQQGGGAAAAAAAAAAVLLGEEGRGGLPALQLKGAEILSTLVRLFGAVPDPDAPPEKGEGGPPLVLSQVREGARREEKDTTASKQRTDGRPNFDLKK